MACTHQQLDTPGVNEIDYSLLEGTNRLSAAIISCCLSLQQYGNCRNHGDRHIHSSGIGNL